MRLSSAGSRMSTVKKSHCSDDDHPAHHLPAHHHPAHHHPAHHPAHPADDDAAVAEAVRAAVWANGPDVVGHTRHPSSSSAPPSAMDDAVAAIESGAGGAGDDQWSAVWADLTSAGDDDFSIHPNSYIQLNVDGGGAAHSGDALDGGGDALDQIPMPDFARVKGEDTSDAQAWSFDAPAAAKSEGGLDIWPAAPQNPAFANPPPPPANDGAVKRLRAPPMPGPIFLAGGDDRPNPSRPPLLCTAPTAKRRRVPNLPPRDPISPPLPPPHPPPPPPPPHPSPRTPSHTPSHTPFSTDSLTGRNASSNFAAAAVAVAAAGANARPSQPLPSDDLGMAIAHDRIPPQPHIHQPPFTAPPPPPSPYHSASALAATAYLRHHVVSDHTALMGQAPMNAFHFSSTSPPAINHTAFQPPPPHKSALPPAKLEGHPILGRLQLQPAGHQLTTPPNHLIHPHPHHPTQGDQQPPVLAPPSLPPPGPALGKPVDRPPQSVGTGETATANIPSASRTPTHTLSKPIHISAFELLLTANAGDSAETKDALSLDNTDDQLIGKNGSLKKRLVWTPDLHERFIAAVRQVGIKQAVPKLLVTLMNVDGLTTVHVKSHLQKYRNNMRRSSSGVFGESANMSPVEGSSSPAPTIPPSSTPVVPSAPGHRLLSASHTLLGASVTGLGNAATGDPSPLPMPNIMMAADTVDFHHSRARPYGAMRQSTHSSEGSHVGGPMETGTTSIIPSNALGSHNPPLAPSIFTSSATLLHGTHPLPVRPKRPRSPAHDPRVKNVTDENESASGSRSISPIRATGGTTKEQQILDQTTGLQMRMQMMLTRSLQLQVDLASNLEAREATLSSGDVSATGIQAKLKADSASLLRQQRSIQLELGRHSKLLREHMEGQRNILQGLDRAGGED